MAESDKFRQTRNWFNNRYGPMSGGVEVSF